MRIAIIIAVAIGVCQAQTPMAHGPQFEVASIKPSGVPPTNRAYTMNDTRLELGSIPLKSLIQIAYKVDAYRVSGPDWITTTRFDISAKLPEGATKDQVPEMLQVLLADRFGLVIHKEPKEQSVYALVVGKDGPKLKEGAADNTHPDMSFLNGRRILTKMNTEDGFWSISSAPGGPRIFDAARITMPELAHTLELYVDDPVLDMTGLKGSWQISALAVPLEARAAAVRARNAAPAQPGVAPDPDGAITIFSSMQKLGLALEKRKAPVEQIVVDSANKVPTEN